MPSPATLLCVGETMAMVTAAAGEDLVTAEKFRVDAGGAESNVAAHAAALGIPAAWFSRLGDDALGARLLRQLGERGIDVSRVIVDPAHPTGLYVKQPGSGVVYYRAGSAAAQLSRGDAELVPLDGVALVHLSGITAAISASAAEFLDRLLARAVDLGVAVSFDVNHRAALWNSDRAGVALDALARRADIVFVGRDEAEVLWGTPTAAAVRGRFPQLPELVVKDAAVGATVFTPTGEYFEPAEQVDVVDAVGAGDAFAGGYLAARLHESDPAERLRVGHRRAALTLRTTGDFVDEGTPG